MLVIDDYGYAGIDFHNDPDLVLPEGDEWDVALGKKKCFISFLINYIFFMFSLFLMFLVFDMTFIVLYRSHAEVANQDVPAYTEGCIAYR